VQTAWRLLFSIVNASHASAKAIAIPLPFRMPVLADLWAAGFYFMLDLPYFGA
jgi:hypothetical protein